VQIHLLAFIVAVVLQQVVGELRALDFFFFACFLGPSPGSFGARHFRSDLA
jgi:hypothetical protein